MSEFKAKMHQIVCWLWLRRRPRWGSLQRSSDPKLAFRKPTSKGGKGRGLSPGSLGIEATGSRSQYVYFYYKSKK